MGADLSTFGENVMNILLDRDMTQSELADLVGLHRNRVYRIMRTKEPWKRTVMKFARALEVRPSTLLAEPEDE